MTRKQSNRIDAAIRRVMVMDDTTASRILVRDAFLSRKGNTPHRTAGSTIVPPRDVQATRRYKLPTRREVFRYSQQYGDTVKAAFPIYHVPSVH